MLKAAAGSNRSLSDYLTGAAIFTIALLIFWFSPVHQVTDSHYSMLLSEALLKHRSFALDHFNIPRLPPNDSTRDYYVMNGNIWQLELAGNHVYYYFPPGSSVLSLPAVAIANALGVSAANADGTYNPRGEVMIETRLAAVLMALTAAVFYFTARLLLPQVWSVIIALGGALGTQVWSTASRGLWSHTWETFLIALLVWLLLADATGRRRMNAFALATLLAWLYFVRPNSSVVAVAVAIYVFVAHRSLFWPLIITGFAWLVLFIVYSWTHFGKVLPSYYQASRLRIDLLPVALAGNLFSPSRGIFIYVPVVLFVGYLIVRYWNQIQFKNLVWLSISISALNLLFVSAFANLWGDWWGGASYGSRYSTELAPWIVMLAILGIDALEVRSLRLSGGCAQEISTAETQRTQRFRGEKPELGFIETEANDSLYSKTRSHRGEVLTGAALLVISVFINVRGATSLDTWKWSQPSTDQQLRAQLWDWRHPQFLAGLQRPAPPVEYPIIEPPVAIDVTRPESGKYLSYGWSGEEEHLRWTDGHEATVVFGFNRVSEIVLSFKAAPFLAPPQLVQQKVIVKLNGHELETLLMSDAEIRTYTVKLPQQFLAAKNELMFQFPDAASPESLGVGSDDRILGIKVELMEFR